MSVGYQHHALLYDSPTQLVDVAVPFLSQGLVAGDTVVLTCGNQHNVLLTKALGHDDRVIVVDRDNIYSRSAVAIATYRRMMREHVAAGAGRIRLVGEVAFGTEPAAWDEWGRFEAICNVALAPLPLSSVCAYPRSDLPEPLLRGVEESHPALLTAQGPVHNHRYLPPEKLVRRTSPADSDPVEATDPTLQPTALTDPSQLGTLRALLREALDPLGHEQVAADFVVAIGEVASNGLQHGSPPVEVRLWISPTHLVSTVTDQGEGFDDPLAGYRPTRLGAQRRVGLWLARLTSESLVARRTSAGFTVRLASRLPAARPRLGSTESVLRAEVATLRATRARARAEHLLHLLDKLKQSTQDLRAEATSRNPRESEDP